MTVFILMAVKIVVGISGVLGPWSAGFMPVSAMLLLMLLLLPYDYQIKCVLLTAITTVYILPWLVSPWLTISKRRRLRLIGLYTVLILNICDIFCYLISMLFAVFYIEVFIPVLIGFLFCSIILLFAVSKIRKEKYKSTDSQAW